MVTSMCENKRQLETNSVVAFYRYLKARAELPGKGSELVEDQELLNELENQGDTLKSHWLQSKTEFNEANDCDWNHQLEHKVAHANERYANAMRKKPRIGADEDVVDAYEEGVAICEMSLDETKVALTAFKL
jgi:hypothetical protein